MGGEENTGLQRDYCLFIMVSPPGSLSMIEQYIFIHILFILN